MTHLIGDIVKVRVNGVWLEGIVENVTAQTVAVYVFSLNKTIVRGNTPACVRTA